MSPVYSSSEYNIDTIAAYQSTGNIIIGTGVTSPPLYMQIGDAIAYRPPSNNFVMIPISQAFDIPQEIWLLLYAAINDDFGIALGSPAAIIPMDFLDNTIVMDFYVQAEAELVTRNILLDVDNWSTASSLLPVNIVKFWNAWGPSVIHHPLFFIKGRYYSFESRDFLRYMKYMREANKLTNGKTINQYFINQTPTTGINYKNTITTTVKVGTSYPIGASTTTYTPITVIHYTRTPLQYTIQVPKTVSLFVDTDPTYNSGDSDTQFVAGGWQNYMSSPVSSILLEDIIGTTAQIDTSTVRLYAYSLTPNGTASDVILTSYITPTVTKHVYINQDIADGGYEFDRVNSSESYARIGSTIYGFTGVETGCYRVSSSIDNAVNFSSYSAPSYPLAYCRIWQCNTDFSDIVFSRRSLVTGSTYKYEYFELENGVPVGYRTANTITSTGNAAAYIGPNTTTRVSTNQYFYTVNATFDVTATVDTGVSGLSNIEMWSDSERYVRKYHNSGVNLIEKVWDSQTQTNIKNTLHDISGLTDGFMELNPTNCEPVRGICYLGSDTYAITLRTYYSNYYRYYLFIITPTESFYYPLYDVNTGFGLCGTSLGYVSASNPVLFNNDGVTCVGVYGLAQKEGIPSAPFYANVYIADVDNYKIRLYYVPLSTFGL